MIENTAWILELFYRVCKYIIIYTILHSCSIQSGSVYVGDLKMQIVHFKTSDSKSQFDSQCVVGQTDGLFIV